MLFKGHKKAGLFKTEFTAFFRRRKEFSLSEFLKAAKKYAPLEQEKYNELVLHLKENKKEAEVRALGLKLIVISDTHGYFAFGKERLPAFLQNIHEYDLCILLGDIHPYDLRQIAELIPREKILAIKGNHDSFDLYEECGIKEMSGKTVTCKGVTIACIEGSFRYKNQDFPSFTQYESLIVADRMSAADILISHDCMFEHSKNDAAHAGLVGITHYIYKHAPVIHIHGHLHRSYENVYENGTLEKCIYNCEYIEI